jgi:predicted nucleic acid-binding protein
VQQHHYRLARDWIGLFKTELKTLDALHLAIASAEGLSIVTADEGLSKSAKALGADFMLLG